MGGNLNLVAQAQLDELDAIGEVVPELAGQDGEAVPVAGPSHTLIDLAEKGDVRPMPGQHPGYRLDMAKPLYIPDGHADRLVGPLADGPGTAPLDFPQRRNLRKEAPMSAGIVRPVAHRLTDRHVDLRDGSDPLLDRSADPCG